MTRLLTVLILLIAAAAEAQMPNAWWMLAASGRNATGGGAVDVGSPVAWWKMTGNDTNATQLLDSVGTYNADFKPNKAGGPSLITTNGTYYNFASASSQYFDAGDKDVFSANAMAVSMWVNIPASSSDMGLIGKFVAGSYEWYVYLYGSAGVHPNRLLYGMTTPVFSAYWLGFTPANAVTPGQWTHVVCQQPSCTSTNLTVWINSTNQGLTVETAGVPYRTNTTSTLTIGFVSTVMYLNGNMDDIRFYTNTLTGTQITNLYTTGRQ